MKTFILALLVASAASTLADEKRFSPRRSLIDNDPAVVYVANLLPKEVELAVTESAQVYATKEGGRKLGVISAGKVKLIGFDDRAAKVQGQGKTGWVKPSVLSAKKGNIQELLKTVYTREMEVKKLIDEGEVALGMTREEVCRVLGEPTKKTVRQTKEGTGGTLEFAQFEEIDHFQPIVNFNTGAIFQQFTHTTVEEKSKVTVEFENDVATAIERSDQENGGDVRVVVRPFNWFGGTFVRRR